MRCGDVSYTYDTRRVFCFSLRLGCGYFLKARDVNDLRYIQQWLELQQAPAYVSGCDLFG